MTPGTAFDDFLGADGSAPNPDFWGYDAGPYQDAGTQIYTKDRLNVRLDGQGHLEVSPS